MSQMLCKVVSKKGTARKAFIEGYNVGGKTGTTQKIINGEYSNNFHIASFTGFFPINSPEILITVIVDEAKLKGKVAYGGSVAAPSFKNIAKDCIRFLKIRPYDNSSEYIVSK